CAMPVPQGVLRCGTCLLHPPPLHGCLAAFSYQWPWSPCLAEFKFRGDPGWARPFADLLRQTPGVNAALAESDLLLPMPLSAQRLRERGYNQALLLARQLAPEHCDAGLLLRHRDTP